MGHLPNPILNKTEKPMYLRNDARFKLSALAIATSLALAACGGKEPETAALELPDSRMATPAAGRPQWRRQECALSQAAPSASGSMQP